jgi:hypothetical protein
VTALCVAHLNVMILHEAYKIFVGKPEEKRPLGRPKYRWEDIRMVRVKVKLSLCFFNRAPRHTGVLGEWTYGSTYSLTSALDGPGRFTPRERAPGTHWIGGWVDPRAVLDAVVKRKFPAPASRMALGPTQPPMQLVPRALSLGV